MNKDLLNIVRGNLIGFDRFFDLPVYQFSNFPPHNIIKLDEYTHLLELALAGFKAEEIAVKLKNGVLTISAKTEKTEEDDEKMIYRGISKRAFSKSFKISDDVAITKATFENGLLTIELTAKTEEPEELIKIDVK